MPPREPAAGKPPEPPWYEAAEDLYVHAGPETGVVAALAYREGDRVVPDVVAHNQWHDKVRVPAQFAAPAADPPGPATTTAGAAQAATATTTAGAPGGSEK